MKLTMVLVTLQCLHNVDTVDIVDTEMHCVIMSGVLGGAGAGGVPRPPLYHHRGLHQVDILFYIINAQW